MPKYTDPLDPTGILDEASPSVLYDQPEFDKELVGRLNERRDAAKAARLGYEQSWDTYRRYLKGEQILVHKGTGEIVRLASGESKRLKSTNNVLRPTARSLSGKLSRNVPDFQVSPATGEFEEVHGSKTADSVLQYYRRKLKLDLKYLELNDYLPWAGNAFVEVYWDRQGGNKKAWCATCDYVGDAEEAGSECPSCSLQRETEEAMVLENLAETGEQQLLQAAETGQPLPPEPQPQPIEPQGPLGLDQAIPLLEEIREGDVGCAVHDVRTVYCEPGARDMYSSAWFLIRRLCPVSEIRAMFPEMAPFIQAETDINTDKSASMGAYSVDTFEDDFEYNEHAYLEKWFEKPTEAYPQGRVIWKANDIILGEIENELYEYMGRHPVFHFRFDINIGEFYAEPFLAQAWHRQRELNNLETMIREHIELTAQPKTLIPMQSRIAADEFNATTGQAILYVDPHRPSQWTPAPLSTDLWNRAAQLQADIRMEAGITEQEQGISQSDPNGRAMAIIEAEADQQVGPILARNNDEWRQMYKAILCLILKHLAPERIWNIAGPDVTEMYTAKRLNMVDGWDIVLEEQDSMSRNRAIKLQQAIDLANVGYYLDPSTGMFDKKKFARDAGLNRLDAGYDVEATERSRAASIPEKMRQQIPWQPQVFDDPELFAEVLVGWLRGSVDQEDEMLIMQVTQVWMFYIEWLMTGQMPQPGQDQAGTGEPSQPGSDQSAPGGSANNPGNLGTDQMAQGGIAANAGQAIQAADQSAEQTAQVQTMREG